MAVTLNSSISWKSASGDDALMLADLQPNILKAHARDFLSILFLRFDDQDGGRAWLRGIAGSMKSAMTHLLEIEQFKKQGTPGTPYLGVGLTKSGYDALGIPAVPSDASFRRGMQGTAQLNDPPVDTWDTHFRLPGDLHAVVLIGDADMRAAAALRGTILASVGAAKGVDILGTQDGVGLHNANGDGIEHFGYVDGRSQPLFFTEDIAEEELGTDGIATWSPDFPLGQAIVPDVAAPDPRVHFGSYLVFRKLEQNVKLFKTQEGRFADRLGIEDDERAGAMLVGRFEDGSPVTIQSAEGMHHPVANNFNFDSDGAGAKCPFMGHIRKTNPRGSGGFQAPADERKHLMAHRGQTYGTQADNPNDGHLENKPETDVGLLFMAFNSDLGQQFEFTQVAWANNAGFPSVPPGSLPPGVAPGIDPVIGQMPNDDPRPPMTAALSWGATPTNTVAAVPRAVTMKGGEYFFLPSLAFLRAL